MNEMIMLMFILVILFEIKHFFCDGILQNEYHLGKFKEKFKDYVGPLLDHAAINALGTAIIGIAFLRHDLWHLAGMIGLVELFSHFIIDRIKASPKLLGRYKPNQPQFWHALMFDQMLHRLMNLGYIMVIINSKI